MSFVTITREQAEAWATATLTVENGFKSWKIMQPNSGAELVICAPTKSKSSLELHVYTTINPDGVSRDIGEDAIRVVMYDTISGKATKAYPKVLRTEGATTVFDRITSRVLEVMNDSLKLTFCKKCGAIQFERINGKTRQPFMGCGAYPKCGTKATHILREFNAVRPLVNAITSVSQVDLVSTKERIIEDMTPLVEQDSLYPISVFPHYQYPFATFNRVQSTILQHGYWEQDCNLVLGTSTSTGKTISGELFVWETLKVHQKKVCYVSPLKSLTSEKYEEWSESFGADYKICILTGDYTLTEERAKELNEADLICLTSEMIDSRTRNHKSERSDWLFDVGLVITDESHIISTNRGHAVEVGLMRFCKLVPDARVLMLSATMPNVSEFKVWLTNLNGKETNVINNNWRPTQLQWFFRQFTGSFYGEQQASKLAIAIDLVLEYQHEKTLVFVHDKNTGRQMETMLRDRGVNCAFHNADLGKDDRGGVEKSFKSNEEDSMKVLISTSTLAWGVNTSAVNAIIIGTTRGMQPVDELDIIQMAGRAGRLGKSDIGRCFLICDDPQMWANKVKNPRNITSTLINTDILGFHVLAEIANGEVKDMPSLMNWFTRSLASLQVKVEDRFINGVIAELIKLNMMVITEDGKYRITSLGRVSASLYYYPRDVNHWAMMFTRMTERNLWNSDLALSYALGTTPSWQLNYVPRNEESRVAEYSWAISQRVPQIRGEEVTGTQSVIAADLYDLITEQQGSHMYARPIKTDIDRITGALHWIDSLKEWGKSTELDMLNLRVKFGVRASLAEFCKLPGVGVARAKKLEAAGINSLQEMVDQPEVVFQQLGKSIGGKALNAAKALVREAA